MWIEVLLLFLAVIAYLYYIITKNYNEFEGSGIPFSKPSFPFGCNAMFWRILTGQLKFNEMEKDFVKQEFPNDKVFAYFQFDTPNIVVNDEELAKKILIKDFDHFVDRRSFNFGDTSKAGKISEKFLTNLTGDEWKKVRSLMSGVFTSGKLKNMSKFIVKVGQQMENHLKSTKPGEMLNAKDIGGMYTLDAIATSGFGIESDSFKDPDNMFRKMANKLITRSRLLVPKMFLALALPALGRLLKISIFDKTAMVFFADIVEKTYKKRMEMKEKRNDIIDIIVEELKSSEKKSSRDNFESDFERDAAFDTSNLKDDKFDMELLLVSNAIIFFFAGFDTSSTGVAIIVHYLVQNPELQEKLLNEIDDVLGGSDDVTFDQIQEMKYLDMFISECTRLQKAIPTLERKCTKDYHMPGTNYTVKKGTLVKIFGGDLSTSKKNFVDPSAFNPDNFLPENNPNKFAITMFGQGPRNCIGMRYAMLTLKICIIFMLRKFRLVPCSKTQDTMTMNPKTLSYDAWFKLEERA